MRKKAVLFAAICCTMGANAQLKVASNGNIGLGTTNPQHKIDMNLGSYGTLRVDMWADILINPTGGLCNGPVIYPEKNWYLQLGKDKNRIGTIYVTTIHAGEIGIDSDSTFKCNFQKINKEQDRFKKLKSYKYHFTNEHLKSLPDSERGKYEIGRFGFKAQEIAKIYPELTYKDDSTGKYSVNYIGFIPILVEMVQELQSTVAAQSVKIKELEKSVNNGKYIDPRGTKKRVIAPVIESEGADETDDNTIAEPESIELESTTNAFLFQNTPNPFTAETEIKYYVPVNADNAVIYVFSLNGNLLLTKSITQLGNGSVTISGNELEAGMYIYTLAVDGLEVDSKRMILNRK